MIGLAMVAGRVNQSSRLHSVRGGVRGRPRRVAVRVWMGPMLAAAALALVAGCATPVETRYLSRETRETGRVSDGTLRLNSSTPRLQIQRAAVILDNDSAFERKLALVEGATRQLDLAYYIYADDYSSAVLTDALIRAARRGVRVRLLLDYFRNYRDLDYYAMMERHGNTGAGRFGLLSAAQWEGIPISDVLDLARPSPSATTARWRARSRRRADR